MKEFWTKFWGLAKPVAIITIATLGWFSACNGYDGKLFLAIIVLSIVLRGRAIWSGFVAIYNALFNKQ